MARYTGPVWKKSRRLSFSVLETGEELKKRQYAPGQHGPTKRVKLSGYGTQLREKQRVRNMYGVNERQFYNTFAKAQKMEGMAVVVMAQMAEFVEKDIILQHLRKPDYVQVEIYV